VSRCCSRAYEGFFSERVARRDARRYERRGLDRTSRRVVAEVVRHGAAGRSVLEVGGGVGAVPLELLRAGGTRATVVEMSPAYDDHARRLAERAGLAGRVTRRTGDFATAGDIAPADVVVLNRVVCCDPDGPRLAGAAARHAGELLVMTYPRGAWWNRFAVRAVNLVQRVRREAFRAYVHPPAAIAAAATAEGLRPDRLDRGLVWELRSFVRVGR
jgi:magnesium-protoporphyrin O-methyltransferase